MRSHLRGDNHKDVGSLRETLDVVDAVVTAWRATLITAGVLVPSVISAAGAIVDGFAKQNGNGRAFKLGIVEIGKAGRVGSQRKIDDDGTPFIIQDLRHRILGYVDRRPVVVERCPFVANPVWHVDDLVLLAVKFNETDALTVRVAVATLKWERSSRNRTGDAEVRLCPQSSAITASSASDWVSRRGG